MSFEKIFTLEDIKNDPYVIENILWDVDAASLMAPNPLNTASSEQKPLKGYVFYIDTMADKPVLSMMRHVSSGYGETLAQIDEAPQELLCEAVSENKGKAVFGMYPINEAVKKWLKMELTAGEDLKS